MHLLFFHFLTDKTEKQQLLLGSLLAKMNNSSTENNSDMNRYFSSLKKKKKIAGWITDSPRLHTLPPRCKQNTRVKIFLGKK
jgi:hypothetical protein